MDVARLRLVAVGAVVAAVVSLPAAALSGTQRSTKDLLYKLSVTAVGANGSRSLTEWIAPYSNEWRIEDGEAAYVLTRGDDWGGLLYAARTGSSGYAVRRGTQRFIGSLADRPLTKAALVGYVEGRAREAGVDVTHSADGKTQLRFRAHGLDVVATILEKSVVTGTAGNPLFEIPSSEIVASDTERPAGESPLVAVRAYWFGYEFGRRDAVSVVEHSSRRDSSRAYTTFYELPSAGRRTSAEPGRASPAGEVQVVSQPIGSTNARRTVQALNGVNGNLRYKPWPRSTVKLRNGERVTVVPDRSETSTNGRRGFYVLTKRALVFVRGSFKPKETTVAARALRPIPS